MIKAGESLTDVQWFLFICKVMVIIAHALFDTSRCPVVASSKTLVDRQPGKLLLCLFYAVRKLYTTSPQFLHLQCNV